MTHPATHPDVVTIEPDLPQPCLTSSFYVLDSLLCFLVVFAKVVLSLPNNFEMRLLTTLGVLGTVQAIGSSLKAEEMSWNPASLEPTQMPENFKVAFFGDTSRGDRFRSVLDMVRTWGADMALHLGDFDYSDDPELFMSIVHDHLGDDFPYFASIGNHDVPAWTGEGGYRDRLQQQMDRANATQHCTGALGANMACYYKGLYFVLSGVGIRGGEDVGGVPFSWAPYIEEAFSAFPGQQAPWKVCAWHKNQYLMQLGMKPNEVGWTVYDTCRAFGAIVATGHEHSYARSHLMSDFATQQVASTNNDLELKEGQSFAFVSGVGGHSVRRAWLGKENNPWWASWGAEQNDITAGALLCTLNIDGDLSRGKCEMHTREGGVWDEFTISQQLGANEGADLVQQHVRCKSDFYEVAVDGRTDGDSQRAMGALDIADPDHTNVFRFQSLPAVDVSEWEHIRVQLYGAASGEGDVRLTIRGVLPSADLGSSVPQQLLTRASVLWGSSEESRVDLEDLEFDESEAWNSPNLVSLFAEMAGHLGDDQMLDKAALVVTAEGDGSRVIVVDDVTGSRSVSLTMETSVRCI